MNSQSSKQIQKDQLRKELRRIRGTIDSAQRDAWDLDINRHLCEFVDRHGAGTVVAFMAFDGEPDLLPALEKLSQQGVRLGLPVVRAEPGRAVIDFFEWTPGCAMKANVFGIQEPAGTAAIQVLETDLALLPLVGWTHAGDRLGLGASFYDRLFQPFATHNPPVRMGVGYEVQKCQGLPSEPWDIQMHWMLSENGCTPCPANEVAEK
jgi:5-formyltetrahydrofolate cyclo-ligase